MVNFRLFNTHEFKIFIEDVIFVASENYNIKNGIFAVDNNTFNVFFNDENACVHINLEHCVTMFFCKRAEEEEFVVIFNVCITMTAENTGKFLVFTEPYVT